MKYNIIEPHLQASFYYRLKRIRDIFLQEALRNTVQKVPVLKIDKELNELVKSDTLSRIASYGIRGEVVLPVPVILSENPRLIGYYRLLYGISQKEFYTSKYFGKFRKLEESSLLLPLSINDAKDICESLIATGEILVKELDNLSIDIVHELQLLTLGPQFRGSRNTTLGKEATEKTFSLIKELVKPYIISATDDLISLKNDSKREVTIQFSSDPDIEIKEKLTKSYRNVVSIEIKGGTDFSNIHNRLGEAEKSHLKSKNRGFYEFWTIIRVDLDYLIAKQDSPTTSRFFHLYRIYDPKNDEHLLFRDSLSSIIGIRIK